MKWLLLTFRISFYCQNLHWNSQDKTAACALCPTTTQAGGVKNLSSWFSTKAKVYMLVLFHVSENPRCNSNSCQNMLLLLTCFTDTPRYHSEHSGPPAGEGKICRNWVSICEYSGPASPLPTQCLPSVPPRPRNRAAGQTLMVGTRSFCQCSLWKGYRGFCDNFGRDVRESFRPGNV